MLNAEGQEHDNTPPDGWIGGVFSNSDMMLCEQCVLSYRDALAHERQVWQAWLDMGAWPREDVLHDKPTL